MKKSAAILNMGLIGYGYWGPNLAKNIARASQARLRWICDINKKKIAQIKRNDTQTQCTLHLADILKDPHTHAIVIATPLNTHYTLVKQCLLAGKHVLVEKPFVQTTEQAEELIELAKKKQRILMIGFTLLYHPAIRMIKTMLEKDTLGKIQYIHSTRINLGLFRPHESVVWDLVSHDLAVMFYWFGNKKYTLSCQGKACLKPGHIDTVQFSLNFQDGPIIYILASWLSPVKMRNMIIVGSKKMAFFNDTSSTEKIKIYDKQIRLNPEALDPESKILYTNGSVYAPPLDDSEPLAHEVQDFIDCIVKNKIPISNSARALSVIKALETADRTLIENT